MLSHQADMLRCVQGVPGFTTVHLASRDMQTERLAGYTCDRRHTRWWQWCDPALGCALA